MDKSVYMKLLIIAIIANLSIARAQTDYPVTYLYEKQTQSTAGASFTITLKFKVDDSWYIYAPTGQNAAQGMIETNIMYRLPNGFIRKGNLQLPVKKYKGGFEVYYGSDIKMSQAFVIDKSVPEGNYIINAKITYQACNEKICLPPVTDEVTISVTIIPKSINNNDKKTSIGISFEKKPWQQILAVAKKQNKIIFVDAFTSWCGPCKWMEKNVFVSPEAGDYFNKHFVNAKFDMEKGEGTALAKKYKIHAFPTYLFIDGKTGKLVHRFTGSMELQKFIDKASNALDPEKQYVSLLNKYGKGKREPAFVYNLVYMAKAAGEDSIAHALKEVYLKTQTDLLKTENAKLLLDFCHSVTDPFFLLLQKHPAEFIDAVGKEKYNKKMYDLVYQSSLERAAVSEDVKKENLPRIIESASDYFQQQLPQQHEKLMHNFAVNIYVTMQDSIEFANEMITWFDKHPSTDANELNSIAWNFYEIYTDSLHLHKALNWALQSVALAEGYANLDTVASLYYKTGDEANSKLYAEKAIQKGKAEGQDVSSTEKLLKLISQ
jgi:thiol-disulfide isomerase/thioredoxin